MTPAERQRIAEALAANRHKMTRLARARSTEMSEADAEDLVSDLVLRLFERADLLAQVENLTAYLFRAIANGVTDLVRRRRSTEALDIDQPDVAAGPLDLAEQAQLRQRLDKALNRLSEAERAIWVAIEVEGHSFRELAEAWQQPIGTLLSRKNRATKALRLFLSEDSK